LGLDDARRVRDGGRDELRKARGQIRATGGNVERRPQLAMLVEDRRRRAEEARIAAEEMLVAVDHQRSLFDQTGTDGVGALELLAPDGAGPQPPGIERGVVAARPAPVDDDAIVVSQNDRTAGRADGQKKAIETALREPQQRAEALLCDGDLSLGQAARWR